MKFATVSPPSMKTLRRRASTSSRFPAAQTFIRGGRGRGTHARPPLPRRRLVVGEGKTLGQRTNRPRWQPSPPAAAPLSMSPRHGFTQNTNQGFLPRVQHCPFSRPRSRSFEYSASTSCVTRIERTSIDLVRATYSKCLVLLSSFLSPKR